MIAGIQPNTSISRATPPWVEAWRKVISPEQRKVRRERDIQVSISVPRKANMIFVAFIQDDLEGGWFVFTTFTKGFAVIVAKRLGKVMPERRYTRPIKGPGGNKYFPYHKWD